MIQINYISIIIILTFIIPILRSVCQKLTAERIYYALTSLIFNIQLIFSLLVSVYITRKIYIDHDTNIYYFIYSYIPNKFKDFIFGNELLIYFFNVPILVIIITIVFSIILNPLFEKKLIIFSKVLFSLTQKTGGFIQIVFSCIWNIPRAIVSVLIISLILFLFTNYFPNSNINNQIRDSNIYSMLYEKSLSPILNSSIVKKFPVLVNDSFKKSVNQFIPENSNNHTLPEELIKKIRENKGLSIKYFNGVTLSKAIESNSEIDSLAKKLTENSKNDRDKAYSLYRWITKNIKYDYKKADLLTSNNTNISSGSIDAYTTRKGVCFDFSCLYISMCRSCNLKVRLITGLGYSGTSWGDHAWNQVFVNNQWINVDSTFGSVSGNYFGNSDFNYDHQLDEIQGEW